MEIRLGCDYVLTDTVSLASSYSFVRETWDGVHTDIHAVSLEAALTPIETAQVAFGLELSHEPYFLEWSTDFTLLIGMDLL